MTLTAREHFAHLAGRRANVETPKPGTTAEWSDDV